MAFADTGLGSDFYPLAASQGAQGQAESPAGPHYEGHRANRGRMTDVFQGMVHWVKKRLPSPGALNYAYSTLALYELNPIGPAVASRKLFRTVQPPQLYMNGQLVGTVGIGGLAAGQYISQPLLDPTSQTYGGVPIG